MTRSDPWLLFTQMREAASKASSYIGGLSRDEFFADRRTQDAVAMNLLAIGEVATKFVRQHPGEVERYSRLPWTEMRGLRNRIAHDYVSLDMNVVWDTASIAVPKLIVELTDVLSEVEKSRSPGEKSPKGSD